ncbi:MAG: cupin domain-containing protein [Candidatus Altiarchaeota archaeon]
MDLNRVRVVEKPWGREVHFALEGEYVGKLLEVKRGCRLSLQYHEKKKETMYVLSGRVKLTLGSEEKILPEGSSVTIKPGVRHRVEALENARIVEVSTTELEDVIRVEDDYFRVG